MYYGARARSPVKREVFRWFLFALCICLCYTMLMINTHKCGACEDNGFIDEQETVYCDCDAGDLMAEVDAEMRAEEESERCGTDYAYAVDSQGDDSPPSDWY